MGRAWCSRKRAARRHRTTACNNVTFLKARCETVWRACSVVNSHTSPWHFLKSGVKHYVQRSRNAITRRAAAEIKANSRVGGKEGVRCCEFRDLRHMVRPERYDPVTKTLALCFHTAGNTRKQRKYAWLCQLFPPSVQLWHALEDSGCAVRAEESTCATQAGLAADQPYKNVRVSGFPQ